MVSTASVSVTAGPTLNRSAARNEYHDLTVMLNRKQSVITPNFNVKRTVDSVLLCAETLSELVSHVKVRKG